MRTIEAQLHDILTDLFPDQYNSQNQAKIVAEATDIYLKNNNKRSASKTESGLVKALWTALASLGLDEDLDENDSFYVDGFGLDPNQIIRSAVNKNNIANLKLNKLAMEILNDSELSVFLSDEIPYEYNLYDATDDDLHPQKVYNYPENRKKHPTDSRITPG